MAEKGKRESKAAKKPAKKAAKKSTGKQLDKAIERATKTVKKINKKLEAKQKKAKVAGKGKGNRTGRALVLGKDGKPRVCSVKDCGAKYRCGGYCGAHYQFARVHGWPLPPPKTSDWRPPAEHTKARAEGRYVPRAA